jgi:hypothetical protein
MYLPPSSNPGQQHVAYRADDGAIWDAWFDGRPGDPWAKQKLNIDGDRLFNTTNAPPAVGPPSVWVVPDTGGAYHIQQHFTYLAAAGEVWDAWYDFPKN